MPRKLSAQDEANLPEAYPRLARALNTGRTLAEFGLRGTRANVYRFANRYKVAHAFRGIQLVTYSAPTVRAYGALFRILVTWSAAEQYLKITGLADIDDLLPIAQHRTCLEVVRSTDKDGRFFQAVCERTRDTRLANDVANCLKGRRHTVIPLVKSVRHAFAHGDLAPGANNARPGVAQKFSRAVCPMLLKALDLDFTKRVGTA